MKRIALFVGAVISCVVATALIVGILDAWSKTGPNCPAPVPANWQGYCEAYDLR